jgi:hypothetical protein
MCRVRCRGDSGLKTGPGGGKARYDPYAGIMVITPGGIQTFRRLKDISARRRSRYHRKQRDVGAIAECIVLHNPELLDSRDARQLISASGQKGEKAANWEDVVHEL